MSTDIESMPVLKRKLGDRCPVCALGKGPAGRLRAVLTETSFDNGIIGPGGRHGTITRVSHLACESCGARFEAELAGTDLEAHLKGQAKAWEQRDGERRREQPETLPPEPPADCGDCGRKLVTFDEFEPQYGYTAQSGIGTTTKIHYCPCKYVVAYVSKRTKRSQSEEKERAQIEEQVRAIMNKAH